MALGSIAFPSSQGGDSFSTRSGMFGGSSGGGRLPPGQSPPGSESFPGGRREWEPEDARAFGDADPLNPGNNTWGENLSRLYSAEIEFAAWSRMLPLLRGQAWREREISAFLRRESYHQRWDEQPVLPGFESMGVGRRPWEAAGPPGIGIAMARSDLLESYRHALCAGNYQEALFAYNRLSPHGRQQLNWDPLAMVLAFRPPLQPAPTLYANLRLDPFQFVESRVEPLEDYGLHELVPVIFEESREYLLRGSPPASLVMQGGHKIYTKPQSGPKRGAVIPGTLTSVVEYTFKGQSYTGLLGAQHVFGDAGELVYHNGRQVGKVACPDPAVDVALAELTGGAQWRREILNRNLDPATPITPVSGMPGEYYGAISGVISQKPEESYIGLVYIEPPSFYKVGKAPKFEMEGGSANGDSGALVLSGHNQQDAFSPNLKRYVPSLAADQLAAILGMLVAGDPARPNCLKRASILATPAKDIQAALTNQGYVIKWLTR